MTAGSDVYRGRGTKCEYCSSAAAAACETEAQRAWGCAASCEPLPFPIDFELEIAQPSGPT